MNGLLPRSNLRALRGVVACAVAGAAVLRRDGGGAARQRAPVAPVAHQHPGTLAPAQVDARLRREHQGRHAERDERHCPLKVNPRRGLGTLAPREHEGGRQKARGREHHERPSADHRSRRLPRQSPAERLRGLCGPRVGATVTPMGTQRPAPPGAKPRGRRPLLAAACAALCLGCAPTTTHTPGGDASVDDAALDVLDATAEAPADVATDARRCDPSALADAGALPDAAPPDGPYVAELSLRGSHECARMSDGTVRCFGLNDDGQLGDGTTTSANDRPARVDAIADAEQVVAEHGVTCARLRDGTVRCWGSNRYDQLGVGHAGDEPCRYDRHEPLCRLRPVAVPGLTGVVHLAASEFTYCAVRRGGDVWCWGSVGFPVRIEARSAPTPVRMPGLDDIVWMRATLTGWIARHRDGRYEVFNTAPLPIPVDATVPSGAYNSHVCYLLPDSSVRCVGINANGKLGNGRSSYPDPLLEPVDPGLCGVRAVVTGGFHTCALLADRRAWCWGDPRIDDDDDDGLERCVGINRQTACMTRPTLVEGLDQVVALFAGTWETCAIRADRSVWCWGRDSVRPARVEW